MALFDLVRHIVACSPTLSRIRVIPFRQRSAFGRYDVRDSDGLEISYEDVWFRLESSVEGLGLRLFVRDLPPSNRGAIQDAVYLLLDNAIGEFDVAVNLAWIEWEPLSTLPSESDLLSLSSLARRFDSAMAGLDSPRM